MAGYMVFDNRLQVFCIGPVHLFVVGVVQAKVIPDAGTNETMLYFIYTSCFVVYFQQAGVVGIQIFAQGGESARCPFAAVAKGLVFTS